jgi:hypothetical protein
MLKIRQSLLFQQSPKHPGLVSRFLQGHFNLKEGHQQPDLLLWNLHLKTLDFQIFRSTMRLYLIQHVMICEKFQVINVPYHCTHEIFNVFFRYTFKIWVYCHSHILNTSVNNFQQNKATFNVLENLFLDFTYGTSLFFVKNQFSV